MFAGINVCVFEEKPCSWGLIFAIRSDLVSYLGTEIIYLRGIYFYDLKMVAKFAKSLANINEFTVYGKWS